MDISQTKVPKWAAVIIIVIIIGFGLYAILFMSKQKSVGENCFNFNEGTSQEWTLDQLYNIDLNKSQTIKNDLHLKSQVKISYQPFQLSIEQGELQAVASTYSVPDSTANNCLFYFVSPDLTDNPDWQNITGFSFDITRNFTSSTGDWYDHKVFAEIVAINEAGGEEVLFENFIDPSKKSYLGISNLGIPYYLRCIPVELSEGNYTLKELRIGCILIGHNFNPNTEFNGNWRLTNVCPVY